MSMKIIQSILCGIALCVFIATAGCSRDYGSRVLGTWDAGIATGDKNIRVILGNDGKITASVSNTDIRPIVGKFAVSKDRLVIQFPQLTLNYSIQKCDGDMLVMSAGDIRVTWKKIRTP